MMHNENDRPEKKTKQLASIPEKTYRYLFQLLLTPEVKVCVCVYVCTRAWWSVRETRWMCVWGKELLGVGYYSLAI